MSEKPFLGSHYSPTRREERTRKGIPNADCAIVRNKQGPRSYFESVCVCVGGGGGEGGRGGEGGLTSDSKWGG